MGIKFESTYLGQRTIDELKPGDTFLDSTGDPYLLLPWDDASTVGVATGVESKGSRPAVYLGSESGEPAIIEVFEGSQLVEPVQFILTLRRR